MQLTMTYCYPISFPRGSCTAHKTFSNGIGLVSKCRVNWNDFPCSPSSTETTSAASRASALMKGARLRTVGQRLTEQNALNRRKWPKDQPHIQSGAISSAHRVRSFQALIITYIQTSDIAVCSLPAPQIQCRR